MRGEVILLTRNIVIQGDDQDEWGCSIMTTDLYNPVSKASYYGKAIFDNVEVSNCSQRDTFRAAIRFENARADSVGKITGCSIHHSLAWSLYITNSKNIDVIDSSFVMAKAIGINLHGTINVHLDGVFVGDVTERENTALDGFLDKRACIAFCSYFGGSCIDSSITNSIVAGCPYAGFVTPGDACDSPTSKFKDNSAHSVTGNGAVIYPDPAFSSSSQCYEGSYFSGYKNTEIGAIAAFVTREVRFHHMTLVDNVKGGMSLNIGGSSDN
jgi:hypothetical protein